MTVLRDHHSHCAEAAYSTATATFTSRRTEPDAVMVIVEGDIDASNTDALLDFVETRACAAGRLILDCTGVTFFAIEGFSTLQRINVMCAQSGATWVLVPSGPVCRVLTLCKPGRALRLVR